MGSKTKLSEMFDYCSDSSLESEDIRSDASPAVTFENKCLGQGRAQNKPASKSRLSQIFDSCSIKCEDVSTESSRVERIKHESTACGSSIADASLMDNLGAESLQVVSSQQEEEVKTEDFTALDTTPKHRHTVWSSDKGIALEFRDSLIIEISSDSDDEENNEPINKMLKYGVKQYFKDSATATDNLILEENSLVQTSSPFKSGLPSNAENSLVSPVKLRRHELFGSPSSPLTDSDDDDDSVKRPKRMKRGNNFKLNADVNEAEDRIGKQGQEDAKEEKVKIEEQPPLTDLDSDEDDDSVKLWKRMKGGYNLKVNADVNEAEDRTGEGGLENTKEEKVRIEEQAKVLNSRNLKEGNNGASSLLLTLPKQSTDLSGILQGAFISFDQINHNDDDFSRDLTPIYHDEDYFARDMAPVNEDDKDFARDMALAIEESLRSCFPRGAEQEARAGSIFIPAPKPEKDVTTKENKPKRSQMFDCFPDSVMEPGDIPSEPNMDLVDDQFSRDMARAIRESLATSGSNRWAGPAMANNSKWTSQSPSTSVSSRQQTITNSVGHCGSTASTFQGQGGQSTSTSRGHTGQPVPNLVNKAWEAQRNDLFKFGISEEERNRMLGDFGNNNVYGGNKLQDDRRRARAIEKAMKSLHTSLQTMPLEGDIEEQPVSLRAGVKLFHHQKQALAWLLWRETQHPPGGILADDMGLGKTLTMISLVLKHRELEAMNSSQNGEEDAGGTETFGKLVMSKATLIICPASLLGQWEKEVENKVKYGQLKVLRYHGSNRRMSCKELAKHDIVITTYGTVQSEVKSQLGDKIEKDVEIKMADMGAAEDLCSTKGYSELLGVAWQRIILDEAHIIRNPKSLKSQAICRLRAERRWCLSGTPIHNKELDLYALLRFLRCSPFDEYKVWKRMENKSVIGVKRMSTLVKSLLLRRLKETKVPLTGRCIVELPRKIVIKIKEVLTPQEREVYDVVFSFAQEVLERFMSQKIEKERVQELGYRGSRTANRRPGATGPRNNNAGGTAVNKIGGEAVNNRTETCDSEATRSNNPEAGNAMEMPEEVKMYHLLVLLLRLRQICCHPRLIKSMLESDEDDLQGEDGEEGDIVYPRILSFSNKVFDDDYVSSKVSIVVEELRRLKKEQDETGFVEKIVIVSQWTKLLDLVKIHVEDIGMSYTEIKGKIPIKERENIVEEFNKSPCKPEVMFLSLAAGGVGLNLCGANHLFLLDMHWNPQQEAQACDRIYRVGQIREVKIHKFLVEDSIEERVLLLQEKKLKLAHDVLTGAKRSGANKLTLDDLKMLFQIK